MAKRLFVLLVFGLALAFGQRIEVGGWLGSPPASIGTTLHLVYPKGDWRFDLYARSLLPRVGGGSAGFSVARSLEAGLAGRAEVRLRAHLGSGAHYWLEGRTQGALARTAFCLRLGYTEGRPPNRFWPFERETPGLYADLNLTYRVERRILLQGAYRFSAEGIGMEFALAWFSGERTYTLGAGAVRRPADVYALLGLHTPFRGALVSATLRVGAKNAFALKYADRGVKGRLELGYPARARAGLTWSSWAFDVAVGRSGLELFLRYGLRF